MVIAGASGISGYHRSIASSRPSAPSPTSCSAIVAVKDFVMLPIGACRSAVIARPVFRSATPRVATQLPFPGIQRATAAPGKPDPAKLSSSALSRAARASASMVARRLSGPHGVDHFPDRVDDELRRIGIDVVSALRRRDEPGIERRRKQPLRRPPVGECDAGRRIAFLRRGWRLPRLVGGEHDGRQLAERSRRIDPGESIDQHDRLGSLRRRTFG